MSHKHLDRANATMQAVRTTLESKWIYKRNKWRDSIHLAKVLPGADCGIDWNLLTSNTWVKLGVWRHICNQCAEP